MSSHSMSIIVLLATLIVLFTEVGRMISDIRIKIFLLIVQVVFLVIEIIVFTRSL